MRVTRSMITRSILASLEHSSGRLARTQDEIGTGRRLLRASDDPGDAVLVLDGRRRLAKIDALLRNNEKALSTLSSIDASLDEVGGLINRAKEIAIQSANAPVTSQDREAAAVEIDGMISRLLQIGNSSDGERFLFGGHQSLAEPFASGEGGIVYRGDSGEAFGRIDLSQQMPLLFPGSRLLGVAAAGLGDETDLDPDIWEFTPLADLNGGTGLPLSQILIVDESAAEETISLVGASTVGDIIDRINDAGLGVTASLNAARNGIALASAGGGDFTVDEVGDGASAAFLGILGTFTASVEGADLDPRVSLATDLSLLRSGSGVEPAMLRIEHEIDGVSRIADLDLSFARTVGDLMVGIDRAETATGESLQLEAVLNDQGTGILIRSKLPNARLSISNSGTTPMASQLGVAGSAEPLTLFGVLEGLSGALRGDDQAGIENAIGKLDAGLDRNLIARVDVGARVERTEAARTGLETRRLSEADSLSRIEDVDLAEVILRANEEQIAYEAALSATSRTISMSLIDFLR